MLFEAEPKRIVHATHHKAGTVWFRRVLRKVAREFDLSFAVKNSRDPLDESVDIILDQTGSLLGILPDGYIGSHMVRDPRDMVVSAYFYHLKCNESWALEPKHEYGGLSYQEHLNSLPQEAGLALEIDRTNATAFRHMRDWDYSNPNILELRYEDCIGRDEETFKKVFKFYGFSEGAIHRSVQIAKTQSLSALTGRGVGERPEDLSLTARFKAMAIQSARRWTKTHIRSGKAGQWHEVFSKKHIDQSKETFSDLLISLEYEKNTDW